jgi:acetyl esterase/lipase
MFFKTKHESIDGVDVLIHSPVNTEGVLHPGIIYFHGGGWISGSTGMLYMSTMYFGRLLL